MAYGSVLSEALDTRSDRKARGAFYTPPRLAEYICKYCIRGRLDRVLEPSCGEAVFLSEAANRLKKLGASLDEIGSNLTGVELHEDSAAIACSELESKGVHANIEVGDFFDLNPTPIYTAIVGNPPYIRFQDFTGSQRNKAIESAFSMGVAVGSTASSWAPFVVHAARFLSRGGRMGMVLPAELLSANYAASIRRFFLRRFSDVKIVSFEKRVFPEVQEEVVLLLADGFDCGSSAAISLMQAVSTLDLGKGCFRTLEVDSANKWPIGFAYQSASELLSKLPDTLTTPLGDYGEIKLGAVTGANKYFTLSSSEVQKWGLGKSDLEPICPSGSRHLRRFELDEDDFASLVSKDMKTWLFSPQDDQPSGPAKKYIAYGESLEVNQAYKCRVRSPWWRVPGVKRCDIFLTYMNGMGPNLCFNSARIAHLNSVHGLILNEDYSPDLGRLLPFAAMSSLSLVSAELVGRSYGGGVLKLEPREARKWLMPSADILLDSKAELLKRSDAIGTALSSRDRDAATVLVDEILYRRMGISAEGAQRIRGALFELRGRRLNRANSPKVEEARNGYC